MAEALTTVRSPSMPSPGCACYAPATGKPVDVFEPTATQPYDPDWDSIPRTRSSPDPPKYLEKIGGPKFRASTKLSRSPPPYRGRTAFAPFTPITGKSCEFVFPSIRFALQPSALGHVAIFSPEPPTMIEDCVLGL
jgi:hypothetical protein